MNPRIGPARRAALTVATLLLLVATTAPAPAKPLDVVSGTLENGIRVFVSEDHSSPIVALHIWVGVGGIHESIEERGLSHVLEHMLFKGTKKRGLGVIDREIDTLGGYNNAATFYDWTYYQVVGASAHWKRILEIQADVLTNASIDPHEVEKERKVVIEELKKGEDEPGRVVWYNAAEALFKNLPYQFPVIGFEPLLQTISRDRINDYYERHYIPENMAVVVVGDVKAADAIAEVGRALGSFRRQGVMPVTPSAALEPKLDKVRESICEMDIHKTYAALAWHGVPLSSPDVHALDLLFHVLGVGRSSRLNQEVREKKKLVDTISAGAMNFKGAGMLMVSFTLDPKGEDAARRAILGEVARLAKEGPTDDELALAKNATETAMIFHAEDFDDRAEWIGSSVIEYGDPTGAQTYVEKIKAVKKEDVMRVAATYLSPENYVLSLVRPRSGGEPAKEPAGKQGASRPGRKGE